MIIIIGATGHGKSALAQAIKTITGKQCEVMNTQDLIQISKEKSKLEEELISIGNLEELSELKIDDRKNHRKKGKEVKPWQRTKFYQR